MCIRVSVYVFVCDLCMMRDVGVMCDVLVRGVCVCVCAMYDAWYDVCACVRDVW